MPIYEYRCDACSHELEALQKMSDDVLTRCPECEQDRLIKKVSAAAFRLKGSGWYETDFKSGDKKNLASTEPAASKKEAKSEVKKEAKTSSGNSSKPKD